MFNLQNEVHKWKECNLAGFAPLLNILLAAHIFSLSSDQNKQMLGENIFQETNLIIEIVWGHATEKCHLSDQAVGRKLSYSKQSVSPVNKPQSSTPHTHQSPFITLYRLPGPERCCQYTTGWQWNNSYLLRLLPSHLLGAPSICQTKQPWLQRQ